MMLKSLSRAAASPYYWLLLIVGGIAFEAIALYYQYVLEEPPCVLCIQVRLWVMAVVLFAGLFLILRSLPRIFGHLVMLLIAVALTERSYQLLGNERGFIIGLCGFDLGLPAWFTPDTWWPWLFEVQTTCGYTPVLVFGITMAEALIVGSALFAMLSAALAIATCFRD